MSRSATCHWLYINEDTRRLHTVPDHAQAVADNPHMFDMETHDIEIINSIATEADQVNSLLIEAALEASWAKIFTSELHELPSYPKYIFAHYSSEVITNLEFRNALLWLGKILGFSHRDHLIIYDRSLGCRARTLYGDLVASVPNYKTKVGEEEGRRPAGDD